MKNTLFEIKNISVEFGKKTILDNISMEINKGDFLVILGENGSGKSTLIKTLNKINNPSKGNVLFKNKPLFNEEKNIIKKVSSYFDKKIVSQKELSLEISYVPQISDFPTETTVYEFVKMGRFPYANFLGVNLDFENEEKIIDESLERMGILNLKNKFLVDLSGGQRQKALIALSIAQDTETIILDEPTNHLDIHSQLEIYDLLTTLNKEYKKNIILVTHDLSHGIKYANKVCFIKKGKIEAFGTPKEVFTKKNVLNVFGVNAVFSEDEDSKEILNFELPKK